MSRIKGFILIVLLSLQVFNASADDVIVMKNGDLINAVVTEITPVEIKYKKASRPDGPTYTINKSDVLAINYEDGEKEVFDSASATNQAPVSSQDSNTPQNSLADFDSEINRLCIENFYNSQLPEYTLNDKDKNADMVLVFFDLMPESVLADDVLEVSLKAGSRKFDLQGQRIIGYKPFEPAPHGDDFVVVLRNKSNSIVFVDLQNSFVRNSDRAHSYYIPSATTNSATSGMGIGVNLGAVSPVLGGVSVGAGQSSTKSTTVFSQRFLQIPPMSIVELDPHNIWIDETICEERMDYHNQIKNLAKQYEREGWFIDYGFRPGLNFSKNNSLKRGERLSFTPSDFSFRLGCTITYSEDPEFVNQKTLNFNLFIKDIIGYYFGTYGRIYDGSNFEDAFPGVTNWFTTAMVLYTKKGKPTVR